MEIKLEYESKIEKEQYLNDLKEIIINSKSSLEGNCFYHNGTLNLSSELYPKQLNLFWCGKQGPQKICEIGFNAGHSAMLLLLGSKPSTFTIFDIGHHSYSKPAFEYIQSKFTNTNFEYIEGDSTITVPKWINEHNELYSYDIVHVDGGHSDHCISNDMKHAHYLVKKNGIIIIDDTNFGSINKHVDLYLSTKKYIEVRVFKTYIYQHRIIQKIIN